MSKPRVLVLGATGGVGRHLVSFLVKEGLVSKVRAVDKAPPMVAYLNKEHAAVFEDPAVEFMQGNLSNDSSIKKCFTDEEGGPFNFVINCAGETKYSQDEKVYQQKVFDVSVKCAKAALEIGCERFIEMSTAQVYDGSKKAKGENGKISPWTHIADYKHKAEEQLNALVDEGLNLVIVRPAIIYGPSTTSDLTARIIIGAVYKKLAKKMEFLWGESMGINTVHVHDVVRALWHLTTNGEVGEVYNLADAGHTTQGTFNKILEEIYGIKTGFVGTIKSNLARTMLKTVCENLNDDNMGPWSDMLKDENILNTPLNPFLDYELLKNNSLAVDGTKITGTGFAYERPEINTDLVREMIDDWLAAGLFPKSILG